MRYVSIVLCGGFARRMWPLTKTRPKQLLEVAGKPILQYTLEELSHLNDLNAIYLSINKAFEESFKRFLDTYNSPIPIKIITEPTRDEEEKLGAIGGLNYVLNRVGRDNPAVVIGGDNLFEFPINKPIQMYEREGKDVVAVYDVKDIKRARLYGIVKLDQNGHIEDFVEKPQKPPSTLAAAAFYIFSPHTLKDIDIYLRMGGNRDALGYFIEWLIKRKSVMVYKVDGMWFDIGSFEIIEQANKYFSKRLH